MMHNRKQQLPHTQHVHAVQVANAHNTHNTHCGFAMVQVTGNGNIANELRGVGQRSDKLGAGFRCDGLVCDLVDLLLDGGDDWLLRVAWWWFGSITDDATRKQVPYCFTILPRSPQGAVHPPP